MISTPSRRPLLSSAWLRRTVLLGTLAWGHAAFGQLIWSPTGPGGTGGTGTWDKTNTNWWNGTNNVVWNGGVAVFAGTGGTVDWSFSSIPSAAGLTFDAPGYALQSTSSLGVTGGIGAIFTITANADATVSGLNGGGTQTLIKNGAGSLTIGSTVFFDTVQINAGEYRTTAGLFFARTTLADNPGVVLTLSPSSAGSNTSDIKSLSGGGIVQPDAVARTVTVRLWDTGSFHGVLQDNGSGKLALQTITNSTSMPTLEGTNTYTGSTEVGQGNLRLSGNGSILNTSSIIIQQTGNLRLDNSTTALANRLPDALDLTIRSGRLELIGHPTTVVEEQVGLLRYAGDSTLSTQKSGAADALLTVAGISRTGHATLNFSGSGGAKWQGMANDSTGIIGASVTMDNEWATVGTSGRAEALASYVSTFAGASAHTKLTAASNSVSGPDATAATLNWQNNTATDGVLTVGAGNTLTLAEGGLLSSGSKTNRIAQGAIRSGNNEFIVTNRNDLIIDSTIGETVSGTGLTKSGAGTLTLTGNNTYSGTTAINLGTLVVSSDANLGTGSTVEFGGPTTLRAGASFSSTKGFTIASNFSGIVDTVGYNVSFSGVNQAIVKRGTGTLTLSNASVGSVSVQEGSLILTQAATGSVSLDAGTVLQARGSLSSFLIGGDSVLDIGGAAAATLATNTFFASGNGGNLTVRFGLGLSAETSDLWTIANSLTLGSFSSGDLLFDFQDLGGAKTGTDYTLMTFGFSPFVDSTKIKFSPASVAAGWKGTFTTNFTSVQLHVTAVPEPGVSTLLGLAALVGTGFRRRRGVKAAASL